MVIVTPPTEPAEFAAELDAEFAEVLDPRLKGADRADGQVSGKRPAVAGLHPTAGAPMGAAGRGGPSGPGPAADHRERGRGRPQRPPHPGIAVQHQP